MIYSAAKAAHKMLVKLTPNVSENRPTHKFFARQTKTNLIWICLCLLFSTYLRCTTFKLKLLIILNGYNFMVKFDMY